MTEDSRGNGLGSNQPDQPLTYRSVGAADREALLNLGHKRNELDTLLPRSPMHSRKSLTIVCEDPSGELVGSVTASRLSGSRYLWVMGYARVVDAARGRGIGKGLCIECWAGIVAAGGRTAVGYVRPENAPSLAMIQKIGFSPVAWKTVWQTRTNVEVSILACETRFASLRGRGALHRAAKSLDLGSRLSGLSTWERPLGPFPPSAQFPKFEMQGLLRSRPSIQVIEDVKTLRTVGVRVGNSLIIGRGYQISGGSDSYHPDSEADSQEMTVFSPDRQESLHGCLVGEWKVLTKSIDTAFSGAD